MSSEGPPRGQARQQPLPHESPMEGKASLSLGGGAGLEQDSTAGGGGSFTDTAKVVMQNARNWVAGWT